MKSSAVLALISAIFPALLAMPGNAQSTRTWVSGVGDDANPCSRTDRATPRQRRIMSTAKASTSRGLMPARMECRLIAPITSLRFSV